MPHLEKKVSRYFPNTSVLIKYIYMCVCVCVCARARVCCVCRFKIASPKLK